MKTDCLDVDIDKLSYFEFVGYVKEIGYNCSSYVVYIRPPKSNHLVKVTCDRDILGIIPKLKNRNVVELYVSHLIEEAYVVPAFEYDKLVSEEFFASFDKDPAQTSVHNLGFEGAEETVQPTVGIGKVSSTVELGGVTVEKGFGGGGASVYEDLGGDSASVVKDLGGTSTSTASDVPVVHSDWESNSQHSKDSDYGDLLEYDDEYGSDTYEEVRTLRAEKRAAKDKLGGDEPSFDVDENASFEIDTDVDFDDEDKIQHPAIVVVAAINVIGGIGRERGT
ncbi:hypothetical protein FXO37_18193 [Capsicum annuum]|nr:hypothetical protein FXO37_18193 [Capsicum annuum]